LPPVASKSGFRNNGIVANKGIAANDDVEFQPGFVGLNRFVGRCLNVLIESPKLP
jgi:hypothetical protein